MPLFYQDNIIQMVSDNYKYWQDIIIKKNIIVLVIIEINENNHPYSKRRMEEIKKKLNCENFLNINPHDLNFSIGKLLKDLDKYI